jgi:glycosyltransferase involved in cell wall biosynthesis
MTLKPKVAYYLSRFPKLSETFILREMGALRELGVDIQIFSVLPAQSTLTMHPQVRALMPYVHYSPFLLSFELLFAQLYFFFRSPRRYFSALRNLLWQTAPEPKTLLVALALFPKSVYFARQLKDLGVEHIHAHFVWLNAVSGQVAADLLGLPLSLHAHAWDIFRRHPECVRRQLALATCVVTVSEYHRHFLVTLTRNPDLDVRVVHYGLDPNEFIPAARSPNNHRVQIISVGRLVEKKGFAYLVEACSLLSSKGIPYQCLIVGEGPDLSLEPLINKFGLQGRVILKGARNISEITELYRSSDIFALPCVVASSGDRDGMPNVLLEAMAMQLPVITTPVTGNPELVHDHINGLLVPERDPASLAIALESLIVDPGLRAQLGAAARQTVLANFDIRSSALRMLDTFTELHQPN